MSAIPLAGIKVLEFSHTVMGPTAGLVFAELGADVIKIEPAPKGDHTRGLGGFGAGFFAAFNRNKPGRSTRFSRPLPLASCLSASPATSNGRGLSRNSGCRN